MVANGEALQSSLAQLRSKATEGDLHDTLEGVVRAARDVLQVDGAGLLLVDGDENLRCFTATDEAAERMETAHLTVDEGPCVECYVTGRTVTSDDVKTDTRWLRLGSAVHPDVRAVAGAPTRIGAVPVGCLNLYRRAPGPWDERSLRAMEAYADVAGMALRAVTAARAASEVVDQLQYALDYRVPIERAIGFVMATEGVDDVTAFTAIRQVARRNRRKVADLAREILGSGPDGWRRLSNQKA